MNQSQTSGVSDSVGKYLAMTRSLEWHGKETNSTLEGDVGRKKKSGQQSCAKFVVNKRRKIEENHKKYGMNNFLICIVQFLH